MSLPASSRVRLAFTQLRGSGACRRYVLGKTKTEDPKHMYYLKRFIAEALKCERRRSGEAGTGCERLCVFAAQPSSSTG